MIRFILDSIGKDHEFFAIPQNERGYTVLTLRKDIWTALEAQAIRTALNTLKISDDEPLHKVVDIALLKKAEYIKILENDLAAKRMSEN